MFARSECWGERPDEVEVTPTCVFVRRDFESIEQTDEGGEPTGVTGWAYDEARMTPGEYAAYAAADLAAESELHEAAIMELAELLGGE